MLLRNLCISVQINFLNFFLYKRIEISRTEETIYLFHIRK